MTKPNNNSKIDTLLKLGKPDTGNWPNYIQKYGFDQDDVPELIEVLVDQNLYKAPMGSEETWAALHAWRVLGQLKSEAAIEPLIGLFDPLNEDDWAEHEIGVVFGLIGQAAIKPLANFLATPVEDDFIHIFAIRGLIEIVHADAHQRDSVFDVFRAYMQNPHEEAYDLNGSLISKLVKLDATELIDEIRHMFSLDIVETFFTGDLESVEIALGFRDKRTIRHPSLLDYNPNQAKKAGRTINQYSDIPYTRESPKVGRNEPCPCESGRKYKKCCGKN